MALPNLSTLSLREAPASTGEFITLSREAADELNESGEVEPISFEEYVPSRERPDESYFKVRNKYMNRDLPRPIPPDTPLYGYKVYDAESLWGWVKDKYTIPHNRQRIWREDWMELHERYDPEGDVPQRVARLPSLTDGWKVFEGSGDQKRLVRVEFPKGQVIHFLGPRGSERVVLRDFTAPHREVHHFEGAKGEERLVRVVDKDKGVEDVYEGPAEQERLVKARWPNGDVQFFEGPKGEERMVRVELPGPNHEVLFYKGAKDKEHLVRKEEYDGDVSYYEGDEGEEHLVRIEFVRDGHVSIFEGPKGEERHVRAIWAHGEKVDFLEGPKGKERKVHSAHKDGEVWFYEGPKDEEVLVRVVRRGGEVDFFSPSAKIKRHTRRTIYPDGRVETVSN
jgi:hypothetical protein